MCICVPVKRKHQVLPRGFAKLLPLAAHHWAKLHVHQMFSMRVLVQGVGICQIVDCWPAQYNHILSLRSDFLKVFRPLNPENIFCSTKIFLLSKSELESAKLVPLWLVRFVDVVLV